MSENQYVEASLVNHRALPSPPQTSAIPTISSGFSLSLALSLPIRIRSALGNLGLTELAQGELRDLGPLYLVY